MTVQEEKKMSDVFADKMIEYKVGGRTLQMQPLPFKRFRVALKLVTEAISQVQATAVIHELAVISDVPQLILSKFGELAPLLFDNQGLTQEWVEENFSVPLARQVLVDAMAINGVSDFLAQVGAMGKKTQETMTPA